MSISFIKKKEDFVCEKCNFSVKGNGYTNHCPKCLHSKHVDIHPGDRASECGGLMEPIFCEIKKNEYTITHLCLKCGHNKKNKLAVDDDFDIAVSVSKKKSLE